MNPSASGQGHPEGGLPESGLPVAGLPDGAQRFLAAMEARYACKKFDGRPLGAELESYLMEIGRLSPSSFGLEHWRFIGVRAGGEANRELREALTRASFDQEAVASAGLILILLVRRPMAYEPDSDFVKSRAARFPGGHPVFREDYIGYWRFLESEGRTMHWARAQAYIALANMMTGAAAAGLDSCAIEGYDEAKVLAALGEDPAAWAVGILGVFGRRAEDVRLRVREDITSIAEFR